MATSFAAQLRDIAANTTNELDLKAQRAAHSTSLIFEKKIAGSQDFDTIYQICLEGFQDLCLLDERFIDFGRSLFSAQSKTQDRAELTKEQNQELDAVIEAYLALVASRLLLKPAVKTVEWLVRRFRIHEFNTSFTILTFLPYYATPIFRNLLSILPSKIDPAFKFLHPYISSLSNPPRHAITYSATNSDGFFAMLNGHIVNVCASGNGYERLLSFWTEIVAEALLGRIDQARSGRREVQNQREQDLLLKVLPTLSDAFAIEDQPELTTACYAITMILASRLALAQKVTYPLMEAVSLSITPETASSAVLCLCVLLEHSSTSMALPKKVISAFIGNREIESTLLQLNATYSIGPFVLGLIETTMQGHGKPDVNTRLQFVSRLLNIDILNKSQLARSALAISTFLSKNRESVDIASIPPKVTDVIENALPTGGDSTAPELIQGPDSIEEQDSDVEMDDIPDSKDMDTFAPALEQIPTTTKETTFMGHTKTALLQQLSETFALAASKAENVGQFAELAILRPQSKSQDPLFFSFFIRTATSSVSPQVRKAAWKVVGDAISGLSKPSDAQILLPYSFVGLSDRSINVRRQAAETLCQIASGTLSGAGRDQEASIVCQSGFYGDAEKVQKVHTLSTPDVIKILQRVVIPALEECVSDANHILRVISASLNGISQEVTPSKSESTELKKNLRVSFFDFIISHISATPSYFVKYRLLNAISHVDKVGNTRKSVTLLPVLQQWCALDDKEVQELATNEGLEPSDMDSIMFGIVSPTDKDAIATILSVLDSDVAARRPSMLEAASKRARELWPQLSEDRQIFATTSLLDTALDVENGRAHLSRFAKEFLRSLDLSTEVLVHILDLALSSVAAVKDQPPSKRRRTSQEHSASLEIASSELPDILRRITFVLELVDSSPRTDSIELSAGLFHVLSNLQALKASIHSELGYLLSLTLGCLLGIIEAARVSGRSAIDLSTARVDLVIDCARVTDNPQVQNSALLLVAALASIAPEHVLHSVMPIFTFMGSNILKKDDEYSAHVINQAIDQIIPPLIDSLRKQKKDIVSGTSDLLLSFAAAFEHMPAHRRLGLFEILIQRLGADDALHAVLAMLANRYPNNQEVQAFSASLAAKFSVETQLQAHKRYLDLIMDTLKPKPVYARTLLGLSGEEDSEAFLIAHNLLTAHSRLLGKSDLKKSMNKALRKDEARAIAIRHIFSELLEQSLSLTQSLASHENLSSAANDLLTAVLDLLSLSELVVVVQRLLERPGDILRTKALRLLETRLSTSPGQDSATHATILALLPILCQLVKEKAEAGLKHAAVACIDQITVKIGRKDTSAIASAAHVISGPESLASTDSRLSTMSLLCLASMVEVLKEAVIPILPGLMTRVFELLRVSIVEGKEEPQLHNASFALLSAILTYVPFMLSEGHIASILTSAYASANSEIESEGKESRQDALDLLARQIDAKKLIVALEQTWPQAVNSGVEAVLEALRVVGIMTESKPKSAIGSNSDILLDLLLGAFDLRRLQSKASSEDSFTEDEVLLVEEKANSVTIQMIYKLNDTIFRPLFNRIVDWATKATDLPEHTSSDIELRQITLFGFLNLFFSTLKSIVTSYASGVLPAATSVLGSYDPETASSTSFTLWKSVISTLTAAFTHDADDFFAIPSHFNALSGPLIAQLSHLSTQRLLTSHLTPYLLPCLTAFAQALTSSPPHLKALNQQLCALRSSEHASVRLASVRVQAALTMELGEEWLANSGEMMVYIQRMLEDDDDKVEAETREWVSEVQEVLGEDVGEMLQS